ncbi:MAG: DMT family transporter [Acidobacteriota bacterium]
MKAEGTNPGRLKVLAILLLGLVAISFGSLLIRFSQEAPPLVISFYRMFWSLVILAPFCYFGKERVSLFNFEPRRLLAGTALALHFAFWISSLSYTSVAVSVLLVNTSPVLVAVLSYLVFSERLSRYGIFGIFLTICGSLLLVWEDLSRLGDPTGAVLALLGAFMLGIYLVTGKKIRSTESLLQYVFPVYFIAALVLGLLVLIQGHSFLGYSGKTYVYMILLGLVPQIMGHTSYNWAIRYTPATLIAVVVVMEPFLATIWAWWLLDELVTGTIIAGGILVAVGIIVIARKGFRIN